MHLQAQPATVSEDATATSGTAATSLSNETASGSTGTLAASEQLIASLIHTQIPEHAKSLSDNVANLENVAKYCEDIYVNARASDKSPLLGETKSYTAQALASVAYQINVLAQAFMHTLDTQVSLVDDMTVQMSRLAHEVAIHKEKVARREIGVLTTNKCVVRTVKIKRPECDEKQVKYVRKPVDYTVLDDVGHGVRLTVPQNHRDSIGGTNKVTRQNSYSSTHSATTTTTAAPATPPPPQHQTPTSAITAAVCNVTQSGGSVRSVNNAYYRVPVAPPSVPSEYLSRQELGIYSSKKELAAAAANANANNNISDSGSGTYAVGAYGGPAYGRRSSQPNNNNGNGQAAWVSLFVYFFNKIVNEAFLVSYFHGLIKICHYLDS